MNKKEGIGKLNYLADKPNPRLPLCLIRVWRTGNMIRVNGGIYCIENILDNKKYIGHSKHAKRRIVDHKSLLRCNNHFNKHLQNAYNKYGETNFIYFIIEMVDSEEIRKKTKRNIFRCLKLQIENSDTI